MRTLYIRADGNKVLGTGHIMRCLSIAEAYKEIGGECKFIVADKEAAEFVISKGYLVHTLHTDWKKLDVEIEQVIEYICKEKVEILLIDSYYASELYFKKLRKFTKLIYLTSKKDVAYDVDAVINYTVGAERETYETLYGEKDTMLLIGPQYAPLRKQFDIQHLFKEDFTDVMIATGGTDANGFSYKLIEKVIKSHDLMKYQWHIIIGAFYSDLVKQQLEAISFKYANVFLYYDVSNMEDIMSRCNVAVSATGSTIYELCACGVPTIAFSFVDNQIDSLMEFSKRKYVCSVGDLRDGEAESINMITKCINKLIKDIELRRSISQKIQKCIDGKGASRLARELTLL